MARARKVKEVAPEPDLTVTAVVTVFVNRADGSARVVVKVTCDGHEALVEPMKRHDGKLNIIGSGLRRVVMTALSFEPDAEYVDMLKVGRA